MDGILIFVSIMVVINMSVILRNDRYASNMVGFAAINLLLLILMLCVILFMRFDGQPL